MREVAAGDGEALVTAHAMNMATSSGVAERRLVAFAAAILGNTDSTDPASQKPDRALARHPSRAHAHGCIGGGFHAAQPRSEAMGRFYWRHGTMLRETVSQRVFVDSDAEAIRQRHAAREKRRLERA